MPDTSMMEQESEMQEMMPVNRMMRGSFCLNCRFNFNIPLN